MALSEAHARQALDLTVEEFHEPLGVLETRLNAMLREIGEPDVNNMYLHRDVSEALVLGRLLRERVTRFVTVADTVSWRG